MEQIVPTLWINDGRIEEAADFYSSLLPESSVTGSNAYGPDAGELAGQKMVIRVELRGQPYVLLNGGNSRFAANESVSFSVGCEDQDEVDRLWNALADGGEPGPCGWIKDRFGFSWQVTPTALYRMLDDPDPERVRRVTECFMQVDKRQFDIAELEDAYAGR